MAEFKLSIGNPKTKKTYKKDVSGDEAKEFLGKKIGDKVSGNKLGFTSYEFEITGGSDASGFPMRKDVNGSARKKILIVKSVGNKKGRKGMRIRKSVAGNTIFSKTTQINLKVLKEGKTPLDGEAEAPAEAAPADAAPAPKAETPKEAPKEETKPEEAPKAE